MFYAAYKTGEGWQAIAYGRVVVFGTTIGNLKHKLASKWEFLPNDVIRCRITGQSFPLKIEACKVTSVP